MKDKIRSLRMERQFLYSQASEEEYVHLYRDLQPGQNVYWNGFGQPPSVSFRASFDDIEFNRNRQRERQLIKGRFASGNLGWIMPEDIELFSALYRKPLSSSNPIQTIVLNLIERSGPYTIQQIKEETGLLVKEITPALHRLQEAFLVYEDQYDGEWNRGWYRFEEMFPNSDLERYTKKDALKIILRRYAYRMVWFDCSMAKSFYKIPEKEIKTAVTELVGENVFSSFDNGYILRSDLDLLDSYSPKTLNFVYAIHRNDILYKSFEPVLKEQMKKLTEDLEYDHEPLQYLFIDGEFAGAVVGHFRNGPYDLNDVICTLSNAKERKDEILNAVRSVNFGCLPKRFMREKL